MTVLLKKNEKSPPLSRLPGYYHANEHPSFFLSSMKVDRIFEANLKNTFW